jgi:hypothetical protein
MELVEFRLVGFHPDGGHEAHPPTTGFLQAGFGGFDTFIFSDDPGRLGPVVGLPSHF